MQEQVLRSLPRGPIKQAALELQRAAGESALQGTNTKGPRPGRSLGLSQGIMRGPKHATFPSTGKQEAGQSPLNTRLPQTITKEAVDINNFVTAYRHRAVLKVANIKPDMHQVGQAACGTCTSCVRESCLIT